LCYGLLHYVPDGKQPPEASVLPCEEDFAAAAANHGLQAFGDRGAGGKDGKGLQSDIGHGRPLPRTLGLDVVVESVAN